MYKQVLDPVGDSLFYSSLFALIPIVTLSEITGLPKEDLGAMVGRQTPFLALMVPLILIGMVDGARGIRQAWPVAAVGGLVFAIGQFACSNYISVELTDIVASLLATGAVLATSATAAAFIGSKPTATSITAVMATGVPKPARASSSAPKQKAMMTACTRWSLEIAPNDRRRTAKWPVSTVML